MPSNKKLLQAAAGNAGESLYVEDVFSTYLYEGNGTSITITNGIDLAGEGGVVWTKSRTDTNLHYLQSSETTGYLSSNNTNAIAGGNYLSFSSDGYTFPYDFAGWNGSGRDYASWTFRKAEKFFDVVTWTGDGTSNRQIAHNLGTTPACIIVKRLNNTANWAVWHQGFNSGSTTGGGFLNLTQAFGTEALFSNNGSAFSDSYFLVSNSANRETNGFLDTYVAYVFASDAGGFGDDDENIIKCGSYTGTGSAGLEVNLGFEPQWVLVKSTTSSSGNWLLMDVMRGMHNTGGAALFPNQSYAESNLSAYTSGYIVPTSTGFVINAVNNVNVNQNSGTYIYIAIRRPMKTPESGTEVFTPALASSSGDYTAVAGFPVDMNIYSQKSSANNHFTYDRLRGGSYLATDTTSAESGDFADWDSMTDFYIGGVSGNYSDYINWMFKRATGFFDVVAYTGDGTADRPLTHNLGVIPKLRITKSRTSTTYSSWWVYYIDENGIQTRATLSQSPFYANTDVVSTSQYIYPDVNVTNNSGTTYITYLFGEVDGVSKIGTYTGNGGSSNIDVDCGFSAGARFLLIKSKTEATNWLVWDSARGIVAGNDPYLLLNSTTAEVTSTDYIDPLASGFTVTTSAPTSGTTSLNASGVDYVFLAIA